ncbi:MAG: DUF4349 domain-containing protein [Pseudobutyrivibrio sp.]|nr:DUF4349 domain-containing protein [Pseudobutyrivibrio sp.]
MRKGLLSLLIVAVMAFTMACGQTDSGSESAMTEASGRESKMANAALGLTEIDSASYDADIAEESAVDASDSGDFSNSGSDIQSYDTERKIVYSSYISIESKKFDEDVATIKQLVSSNGGYFESTSQYGNKEYGNRSADFAARIPADKYDAFMNSVGDVGSLQSKNESIDDVTSSYVDVQARLKSLNTKLERLQELEADAENVTELLEIEDRINDVQYEIENYTAQKKVYDDQVDYSRVDINVAEVATYSEVKADTAWNRFADAFQNSLVAFLAFIQGFIIAIIYLLPYLIILAIVLFIIFRVKKKKGGRKLFKLGKKKDRVEEKNEQ